MSDTRPTLILVSRNLPPLRGGMERLNLHLALGLSAHFRVTVIGPRGSRASLPESIEVHECGRGMLISFLIEALFRALRAARVQRPAWVIAGSGLAAPITWLAARLSGARAAVYVHGLDLVVSQPVYRLLWLPFIRRADACFANSTNTSQLAQEVGVDRSRIDIVNPGVEPVAEPPSGEALAAFRRRHGLADRSLLLSVGRMTDRKGLHQFVLRCLPLILRAHPRALLVVIGDEAPDALAGRSTGAWKRLQAEAASAGLGGAVLHLGALDDEQLALAYAASNVHVFPIRDVPGDVEGFGMVAVEAAAHGLSTVAFDVGGVPDAVAEGVSGHLVAAGDYDGFAQRVIERLDMALPEEPVRAFAAGFAWAHFVRKVNAVLNRKQTT